MRTESNQRKSARETKDFIIKVIIILPPAEMFPVIRGYYNGKVSREAPDTP